MSLTVSFLLGGLGPSGGVRAVIEHARRLAAQHEMDVRVVTWGEPPAGWDSPDVEVLAFDQARNLDCDVAVATWWQTAYSLFELPARRYAYYVQNLEERLYEVGDPERLGAALTHGLPVSFITEAGWLAALLGELRPDTSCRHIPNGIDKSLFAIPDEPPASQGPLRVLVEGSPHLWFKGVPQALEVLDRMTEPKEVTLVSPEAAGSDVARRIDRVLGPLAHAEMAGIYAECDVLLKLSRVEGVFTPPLEAFHKGATCVVTPVTGHDEYVRHGENGVVTGWNDIPGAAGWLDLLHRDRALLERLRSGALVTAREWPSWDDSAALMAEELRRIAAEPSPAAAASARRLLADAEAGMEELRLSRIRAARRVAFAEQRADDLERHLGDAWFSLAALEGSRTFRLRSRVHRLLASVRR